MPLWRERAGQKPNKAIQRATDTTRRITSFENTDYVRFYERCIWVYRALDAIASNQSAIPINMVSNDEGQEVVPGFNMSVSDPRITRLLNKRPNSYETAQMFRYRLSTMLLLSRRGAFIEIVRDQVDRVVELHLLPMDSEPVPDEKTFVSGYRVGAQRTVLPPEAVLWVRTKPHPTDPYAQTTPLQAAGLAADTDWFARVFNRNFLAADGRPGTIIGVKGQLAPEDAQELKRRFSGGPERAGQTTVIEVDGVSINDVGATPRDAQWKEAIQGSKDDILLAFGVPESVIGNASGRTFDNAEAESEIFWSVTMQPHCDAIASSLDPLTGSIWDDNKFSFDYTVVDVLQRALRRKHDKLAAELEAGVITIDDYLEGTGRQRWNVPGTRVLWVPAGKLAVGPDQDTTDAAAKYLQVGQGAPASPEEEARKGAMEGSLAGARAHENNQAARAMRLSQETQRNPQTMEETEQAAPRGRAQSRARALAGKSIGQKIEVKALGQNEDGTWIRAEAELAALVSAWNRRSERVVMERLNGKARKGTRHWTGDGQGEKALDVPAIVKDMTMELAEDVERVVRPVVEAVLEGAERKVTALGVPVSQAAATVEEIVQPVVDLAVGAARRQTQRLEKAISELDREGADLADIEQEVLALHANRESWVTNLASAVVGGAINAATEVAVRRGGRYLTKTWVTLDDQKVRPEHHAVHGTTKRADQPFTVGGFPMMYPGDLAAPPHLTANCRCRLQIGVNLPAMTLPVPTLT